MPCVADIKVEPTDANEPLPMIISLPDLNIWSAARR